jgi:hypothetical protein
MKRLIRCSPHNGLLTSLQDEHRVDDALTRPAGRSALLELPMPGRHPIYACLILRIV